MSFLSTVIWRSTRKAVTVGTVWILKKSGLYLQIFPPTSVPRKFTVWAQHRSVQSVFLIERHTFTEICIQLMKSLQVNIWRGDFRKWSLKACWKIPSSIWDSKQKRLFLLFESKYEHFGKSCNILPGMKLLDFFVVKWQQNCSNTLNFPVNSLLDLTSAACQTLVLKQLKANCNHWK